MWEALGFIVLGVVSGLIGHHLRRQYFRDFPHDPYESDDPIYRSNAQPLRLGAAMFLTSGVMLVIVGVYLGWSELLALLRGEP